MFFLYNTIWRVTFVSAWYNSLDTFLSIGIFDIVADLSIDILYMWVREERGAERVSFNNESFGDFREVMYYARNVMLGAVVFCGGV